MKLDSDFMRQILLLIENNEDYLMSSLALKKALTIKGRNSERKFMGHIMLLADNNVIESVNSKYPFGFVFGVDGEYSIIEASYRLTARGYELIDVIKNDEIFEKVKGLSINNALEIAKQMLIKKALENKKTIFG